MTDPTPERRRELLRGLTQQAIEAGTYGEPAPEMRPPTPERPTPPDDTPICEGSYEWWRREVERLQIENEVLRISAAGAEGRNEMLLRAIARVRQMADTWKRQFPDSIRSDTAAEAVYVATDIKGVTS